MSSSNTVKEQPHPKSRASDDDSPLTSKSSESSAFADSMPSEPQPATYQAHAGDKANAGSTAVHFVWPANTVAASSKEQGGRIIGAIKGVTDRPEEIHNCLLGEVLVYAKASMTAAQAAMLRNYPDIGAVYEDKGPVRQMINL